MDTAENTNKYRSLLSVTDLLPDELATLFPFSHFNAMQSVVAPQVFESDSNIVVGAPTGSGKTVLHELAIIRLMSTHSELSKIKCVLIAPNKALCQQRVASWQKQFHESNIKVLEVTGDSFTHGLQTIARSNIIVTTPEKWDALTRNWKKHLYLFGSMDLMLLDEVHHLGEGRGAILETIVVRMRILNDTIRKKEKDNGRESNAMRIIALSATLPNIDDIGLWLQCSSSNIHYFDDSFRPVPLTVLVESFPAWKNPFLFEKSLDQRVPEIIRTYAEGKQTLIFCSSKKGAEKLAIYLSKTIRVLFRADSQVNTIGDSRLRGIATLGFGYHHAGLHPDDKRIVENLFSAGAIQILCTTSTLAHGVNLPAHLVIVKGTNIWQGNGKGYEKIPRSTIMQMTGRAGRPGLDSCGVGVIMTSDEDRKYYEEMKMDVVESALPSCLVEALCAEITQGVILALPDAMAWLKLTFFFIRVVKNSSFYNVQIPEGQNAATVVQNICLSAIKDLADAAIIVYNSDLFHLHPAPEAFMMTRHLIKFKSMKNLMEMEKSWTVTQLLRGISFVQEAQKPLRRDEKKILNEVMKLIRFPIKTKVNTSDLKAYVLMQSAVTKIFITDYSLRLEQADIIEQLIRVLSALQEHCIEREKGTLLLSTIITKRAFSIRRWETSSESYFEQFDNISESLKKSLETQGPLAIQSFKDIEVEDTIEIQRRYRCSSKEALSLLKRTVQGKYAIFEIICNLREQYLYVDVIPRTMPPSPIFQYYLDELQSFHFICRDVLTSHLLSYRKLRLQQKYQIKIPIPCCEFAKVNIDIISSEICGVESTASFIINDGCIISQETEGYDKGSKKGSISRLDKGSAVRTKKILGKRKKRQISRGSEENCEGDDDEGYKYTSIRDLMVTDITLSKQEKENRSNLSNQQKSFNKGNEITPSNELQLLRKKGLEFRQTSLATSTLLRRTQQVDNLQINEFNDAKEKLAMSSSPYDQISKGSRESMGSQQVPFFDSAVSNAKISEVDTCHDFSSIDRQREHHRSREYNPPIIRSAITDFKDNRSNSMHKDIFLLPLYDKECYDNQQEVYGDKRGNLSFDFREKNCKENNDINSQPQNLNEATSKPMKSIYACNPSPGEASASFVDAFSF